MKAVTSFVTIVVTTPPNGLKSGLAMGTTGTALAGVTF
jgi:hypothetical protein